MDVQSKATVRGHDVRLEEIENRADTITVPRVAELMNVNPNTVRTQLNSGKLVGHRVGREWVIPVIWDENDEPVFLYRRDKKG